MMLFTPKFAVISIAIAASMIVELTRRSLNDQKEVTDLHKSYIVAKTEETRTKREYYEEKIKNMQK